MLKIFETQDGSTSIFNEEIGVAYHSKYGAIQEIRHVYIGAGMYHHAIGRKKLSILEVGFGTGLIAFLTKLEAERLEIKVNYIGIEPFPLEKELVAQLNFPEKLQAPKADFEMLHQMEWGSEATNSSYFSLKKIHSPIQDVELKDKVDIICFDAFTPKVQPELWEEAVLQKCYDWLVPGGVLVTYCANGAFKRTLRSIGFHVEALKGPPGKREMTRAIRIE